MSISPVKDIESHDESTINSGSISNEKNVIPQELVSTILSYYLDGKTLLSCQSVCKQWNNFMKIYGWRKRAKLVLGREIPQLHKDTPWEFYRLLCQKQLFNKNLIKNPSGEKCLIANHFSPKPVPLFGIKALGYKVPSKHEGLCLDCDWTIPKTSCEWGVECPPSGVPPLPDDPVLKDGKNCCFVTHYYKCEKEQVIDLLKEGFTEYLLDYLQPPVKVSEWFSSRWDCQAYYECKIELIAEVDGKDVIFKQCHYDKYMMVGDDQNQWFKFEYEFKNYGKGLRKIRFYHSGQDVEQFEEDHHGCKMAGACVTLGIPDGLSNNMNAPTEAPPLPLEREMMLIPLDPREKMWDGCLLSVSVILLIIVLWLGFLTLSSLWKLM